MKTTIKNVALALIIASSINLEAQDENRTIVRPVHISFVTPMGTNGMESWDVTNNVSLNMFAGYSGGLKGVEFGGFYNVLKEEMTGVQMAGFGNTVLGNVTGAQFSGFTNIANKDMTGMQVSGFANYADKMSRGAQISGFANFNSAPLIGGQISGFSNINRNEVKGAQIAGFSNYAKGTSTVAQVAGFVNINDGNIEGAQISGFSNYSKGVSTGAQVTGFANVNVGDLKGAQISGFANINTNDVAGFQISGFLNYAKTLKGIQLSVFNVADTVEEGMPIGFLSIVKKGYHKFEISSNETMYGTASFKIGVKQFYNIFSVGAGYHDKTMQWGWGYGVGTSFPVHETVDMSIDVISYHVNNDEWWTNHLNSLNKLNITASKRVNNYVEVFGGVTWNVLITDIEDNEGEPVEYSVAPWSVSNKTHGEVNVKMYPGFTVGIRL